MSGRAKETRRWPCACLEFDFDLDGLLEEEEVAEQLGLRVAVEPSREEPAVTLDPQGLSELR